MENTCSEIPDMMDISKENISDLQGMLNGSLGEYELSGKQLELAGEVASALAMHGRFETLDKIIKNMCQHRLEKLLTNESFLRALIALKFEQRKYTEVVNFLKIGQFSSYVGLLEIWDEAHYGEKEAKLGHKLNPLIRFRVRQKNPPPKNICPSGERPSSKLSTVSKDVLKKWFLDNLSNPYPSQETKQLLANMAGLTTYQVKTWFANARRRHRLSGRQTSSGSEKEPNPEFLQEYNNSFCSPFMRNTPSHPTQGNLNTPSYSQPATTYQKNVSHMFHNQCNRVNVQKSSGEFQVSNFSKVSNSGYLETNEPKCSGSCIWELTRMCERLRDPKNPATQVTSLASETQCVPQWTSPGVGPWQGLDTPHPWSSNQTPMVNMSQNHIAPMEVLYQAEETLAYPACNSLPHYFHVTPGYQNQSLQTTSNEFGNRYYPQGVNCGPYHQNESSALISQSSNILNQGSTGREMTSSHSDPYTGTFEPGTFQQTLYPQSEREVAMVLLDLSSDRSAQSSQLSQ